MTMYPAVAVTALALGAGPGALVLSICTVTAYFASPPTGEVSGEVPDHIILAVFVVSGAFICWLACVWRRSFDRLAESERKLRALFEASHVGLALIDGRGSYLKSNDAFRRITGYSADELRGGDVLGLSGQEFSDSERFGPCEREIVHKHGHVVAAQLTGARFRSNAGKSHAWLVLEDVTLRRDAVREVERLLRDQRAINESGIVGIVRTKHRRILWANEAFARTFGYSRDALVGQSTRILHPSDAAYDRFEAEFHPRILRGEIVRSEVPFVHRDGRLLWLDASVAMLGTPNGEHIGGFVDITDAHEARERIRALAQRLETVREEERREHALLLHEGIAQDLFAAQLALKHLESGCGGAAEISEAHRNVREALDGCMKAVRSVAYDLRPTALENLRVAEAIREHARMFGERSGLEIEVREVGAVPPLAEPYRLALFRAAQEALTNVVRHAQASRVAVVLRREDGKIAMDVSDDGVGVPEAALAKRGSLGLVGIRERFAALGGDFHMRSNHPSGTTISVQLPCVEPMSSSALERMADPLEDRLPAPERCDEDDIETHRKSAEVAPLLQELGGGAYDAGTLQSVDARGRPAVAWAGSHPDLDDDQDVPLAGDDVEFTRAPREVPQQNLESL